MHILLPTGYRKALGIVEFNTQAYTTVHVFGLCVFCLGSVVWFYVSACASEHALIRGMV